MNYRGIYHAPLVAIQSRYLKRRFVEIDVNENIVFDPRSRLLKPDCSATPEQ